MGSTRTTDGSAFVLEDETKVGKLLYFEDVDEFRTFYNEYEIGKLMGKANVGPKVYTFYILSTGRPNLVSSNLLKNAPPGNQAIYIIMENLGYGALNLQTLEEFIKAGNPYPYEQIKSLMARMQKQNILHGDLHANNILIKTYKSGIKKVYFIDYGRSTRVPYKNVKNVNSYLITKGYTPHAGYAGYYNSPNTGVPRGVNQKILNRNFVGLSAKLPPKKKKQQPVVASLKKMFKTAPRTKKPRKTKAKAKNNV